MTNLLSMWPTGPLDPQFEAGAVHIWRINLDVSDSRLDALRAFLSPDEVTRAERFHFEHHRRRFVAGRGQLRALLGRYTGLEPSEVRFFYARYGKPGLQPESSGSLLRFNFTNSHERALCALTQAYEIGVDIEHLRPMRDAEPIARRFFTAREAHRLSTLPEAERLEAFFLCWTRKEAFLKATGEGLHFELDRVEVSVEPGEAAEIVSLDGDPGAAARWSIRSLKPEPDYVGAVVLEGPIKTMNCWVFTNE